MPGNVQPATALPSHLHPNETRRISFLSYNDLLTSAPTTVTNLSEITSGQLSPDHLPGTISPNMTSRSPIMSPPNPLVSAGGSLPGPGLEHQSSWDSQTVPKAANPEMEGEWSREGLGQGLEQRLEGLVQSKAA